MPRPSWDTYFMSIVDATALRASCDRGRSACVIVRDKRILGTGYVGAPAGLKTCEDVGHKLIKRCERTEEEFAKYNFNVPISEFSTHCVRTCHSEVNAIVNCARNGVSTLGATLYTTMVPCITCCMFIIQAGIVKVIAKNAYQKDKQTRELFKLTKIELVVLNEELLY